MPIAMIKLTCASCGTPFEKRKATHDYRANKGLTNFYCSRACHSNRVSIALTKNRGTCRVDGCNRPQSKRRWCDGHYTRWRKYGDPLTTIRPTYDSDEDRFWSKVDKSGDCWEWTAAKDPKYGLFRVGRKLVKAHVFSHQIHHGPVPDGMEVCHNCNNPPCVRPNHIYAGTHLENMQDVVVSGSRRPTYCKRGHEFTEANTYVPPNSTSRQCRTCRSRHGRKRYIKIKPQHHC